MPWQPTVHPAAPLAHASSPGAHPPSSAWSPHVPRCLAFLRRCTVGVPANDSQSHLLSHHSLDSVPETVVTAASATVSNIVGMIGTVAGLSVQTATMKVRWYVSPIDVLPTSCQPFPVTVFFLSVSISSTRQMRRSSWRRTYPSISPWRAMPCLTLRRPRGVYLPSLQHPRGPKTTRRFNRARSCTGPSRPYYVARNRASQVRATNCMRGAERRVARASSGPLLPPYHEPLRLHFR
jgi:hypothetical protein